MAYVFAGPPSPGAALIVRSCDTNFSASVNCITIKFLLYLYVDRTIEKMVPNFKSEPLGALDRPLVGPPGKATRLISKVRKSSKMYMEKVLDYE